MPLYQYNQKNLSYRPQVSASSKIQRTSFRDLVSDKQDQFLERGTILLLNTHIHMRTNVEHNSHVDL